MGYERSLTLAFGGGGVKGFAHIGVLRAVRDLDIEVRGIAATSSGAVITALHAAGKDPDEIQEIAAGFNIKALSKSTSKDKRALWGLSRWKRALIDIFGDKRIEDLCIPIAFPLVDLNTNREILLDSGPVVEAVIAAIAIPGIFPPQQQNGQMLIDGGVLNPVPAAAAHALAPGSQTAAVALVPPADEWEKHPFPRLVHSVPLLKILKRLRYTQALSVYVQATDLTNRLLAEYRLQIDAPDFIIRPEVNHLGLFDRIDVSEIVHAGEIAAKTELSASFPKRNEHA